MDEATGKELSLERLREESRHVYLKKREERELQLLKKQLQDEQELFREEELTTAEKKCIALAKQILTMAENRDKEQQQQNDGFYRLPDEMDRKQSKAHQNETLLTSRYVEPKHKKD